MSEIKKNVWIPFGESVRGASHARKDMPRQDAYNEYRGEALKGKEAASELGSKITPTVVAVSDGHGGSKYIRSEQGALHAVKVICNLAESMFRDIPISSERVRISEVDIIAERIKLQFFNMWQRAVDNYSALHPLTDEERSFLKNNCSEEDLARIERDFSIVGDEHSSKNEKSGRVAYGCTFLAVIAYEDVVLVFQYGDGDVLGLYPDCAVKELIEADPRNMGNETLSLCRLNNSAEIKHNVLIGNEIPLLITLSTDGVKNSFDDLVTGKASGFYKIPVDISKLLIKNDFDVCAVCTVLKSELERYTKDGAGDDVTLGVLFNENRLREEAKKEMVLTAQLPMNETASEEPMPAVEESDINPGVSKSDDIMMDEDNLV